MKKKLFRQRLPVLLTILLLIEVNFLAIAPASVFACSCAEPGPPIEELAGSTAVFAGKVIEAIAPSGAIISSADPVKVTFRVSEVWKGPVQNTLVVTTAREDASCGYKFYTGAEYLVYARGTAGELTTGICSRTQPLSTAAEDLTALGAGSIPTVEPSSPRSFIIFVLGGVSIALIILVVMVIRKQRVHPTP